MDIAHILSWTGALAPVVLMLVAALLPRLHRVSVAGLWHAFLLLSIGALAGTGLVALAAPSALYLSTALKVSRLGLGMALVVQLLGVVIGGFSSRYLLGEAGQRRYVAALAGVLASVHLLLLADHWVLLIVAWALVGIALQHLLCFYPDRAFARLAAHKKRIADRVADGLLVGAALLAWGTVGSGSLSDLWTHLEREGMSASLQVSAGGLALAVVLRTAIFPVHGWLIQVMEAPTPVSALLHAGVVNLGGFVLIRFSPLLEQAMAARMLLLAWGLVTAVLAGMVMLTRVSIKVRLAWSTVAQMGFMLLECGLGLYAIAAVHLIGHSLYKAHAFLSASTVVRETRLQAMHSRESNATLSLILAPIVGIATVLLVWSLVAHMPWPWWWSAVLGLAWAPMLWLPAARSDRWTSGLQAISGVLMLAGLTGVAVLVHALPLGIQDVPHHAEGLVALLGMAGLYVCLVVLQLRPQKLRTWRRWSYAGFYVDEVYTRFALQVWPTHWTAETFKASGPKAPAALVADTPR